MRLASRGSWAGSMGYWWRGLCVASLATASLWSSVTFTDSTFNLSDYSIVTWKSDSSIQFSVGQTQSGGNPDQALQLLYSLPGSSGNSMVGLPRPSFTYSPATQGAIQSIDFSVEKYGTYTGCNSCPLDPNTTRLLILQNGAYYIAVINVPGSAGIYLKATATLHASDFGLFDFNTGNLNTAINPNFNNGVIQFGLANRYLFQFDQSAQADVRLDNLSIMVQSVPLAGSTITAINLPIGNTLHLSPGAPMSIAGSNLGVSSTDAAVITIGGKASPVIGFLSAASLLAQVPVDLAIGSTSVTAAYKGQPSAPFNVVVDAFSPAIYTAAPVFTGSGGTPVSATQPAVPGTTVSCLAIGLGATNPPMVTGAKATTKAPTTIPVQVMVGNKMVLPDYAGLLVGSITDYQVTFKVPADIPAGNQPVTLSIGGVTSNSATLQVAPPMPTIGGVVSASAFGGFASVAPGSWVEIYGSTLADHTRQWAGSDFTGINAPTMLDGVQVVIGGQKAYLDFISSGQVNAQLPSNIGPGPMQITLTSGNVTSAPFNITVNATQPGLLAPPSFKIGGNQYVVAQFSDGTYVLPAGSIAGVTSRPAMPGETIVIYGVGFGSVTPNIPAGQIVTQANQLSLPLHILFGQTPAQTPYFGLAPNFVGLYQFNVVVPAVSNNDLVPLTIKLGGVAVAQTLFIAVRQ